MNLRHLSRLSMLSAVAAGALQADPEVRGTVSHVRTIPTVREFTKPKGIFPKLLNWIAGALGDRPEIVRPYATAQDSVGRLLIADPGQQGVHLYDFEKHKYQFLKGNRSHKLVSPIDVACDARDNMYVSDSMQGRIFVFDSRGKFQRSIGDSELKRPTGMSLDRVAQKLYIIDTLRHQLLIYTLDGRLEKAIGRRGEGPAEFNYPTAVTVAAGKVYVVDSMNFRIQTLASDGTYLSSFGKPGNRSGYLSRPKGIALDTDGNIYVVDALFETVQLFDPAGRLLYYFGSSGRDPGRFQLPTGIAIDQRNTIYVADSANHRVEVFRYRRLSQ